MRNSGRCLVGRVYSVRSCRLECSGKRREPGAFLADVQRKHRHPHQHPLNTPSSKHFQNTHRQTPLERRHIHTFRMRAHTNTPRTHTHSHVSKTYAQVGVPVRHCIWIQSMSLSAFVPEREGVFVHHKYVCVFWWVFLENWFFVVDHGTAQHWLCNDYPVSQ